MTTTAPPKKAFIHIGLEKTGTTTVQEFLTRNEPALNAQGFTYLKDDSAPYFWWIGHSPVAACFHRCLPDFVCREKFRPAEEVLEGLKAAAEATDHDIILSCEQFSSRLEWPESLAALRDALAGRDIRILCYLRRQDAQCLAAYSTIIRYGGTSAFDQSGITPDSRYYDYYRILSDWADVFGDDALIVREFDRAALVDGDIKADVLSAIGLENQGFRPVDDANISLDSRQVEILRQINCHLTAYATDVDPQAFEESNAIRAVLLRHLPRGAPLSSLLTWQQRAEILERFAESNAALVERFNIDFVRRWAVPEKDAVPQTSPVSREDMALMVAACGARIREQDDALTRLRAELDKARKDLRASGLGETGKDAERGPREKGLNRMVKAVRRRFPRSSSTRRK